MPWSAERIGRRHWLTRTFFLKPVQCHGHQSGDKSRYPVARGQDPDLDWNRAGIRPPNVDDLGEDVWSPDGVKILGPPVGTEAFVLSHSPVGGSRKNDASGTQSRQCLISNVRGSCCCNVQGHVVIMCCGACPRHNQRGMPDTTRMHQTCWALFWETESRIQCMGHCVASNENGRIGTPIRERTRTVRLLGLMG